MGTALDTENLVRNRIRSGRLPVAGKHRLFGSAGDGGVCACCDRIITASEMKFEVDCSLGVNMQLTLRMHVPCFDVWTKESRAYWADELARAWKDNRPLTGAPPERPRGGERAA